MKAIQVIEKFESLHEADNYFEAMSKLDGFLGGRLNQYFLEVENCYKVLLFFECDQALDYGFKFDENTSVVLILDSQRLAVGIGNSYYQVNPQCPIESKPKKEDIMNVSQVCTVTVKDLKAAVTSAIKAVPKKAAHEVLTFFCFTSKESGLTITGYDLQTGVSSTIASTGWVADTKFLVPAKTLKTWISKKTGECQIELIETEKGKAVKLTVGKTTGELLTRDFEDYPALPEWEAPTATLELDAETLGNAIKACKKFVTSNYYCNNPAMTGVNFSSANGFFTIQSTNRYVISRYQEESSLPDFSLTISTDALVITKKGKVKLNFYAEYLSVENDNTQTFVKTITEPFPAKMSEWQPTIKPTLTVDKKALLNQLEIALAYSKDITLNLETSADKLRIMGDCEDGELFVELPATVHTQGHLISIGCKDFKDAISLSQSANVTLAFDCDWYGQTELLGVIDTTNHTYLQLQAQAIPKRSPLS